MSAPGSAIRPPTEKHAEDKTSTHDLVRQLVDAISGMRRELGMIPGAFKAAWTSTGARKYTNTHKILSIDTSTNGGVNLYEKLKSPCLTLTVLDAGGGIKLMLDDEDAYWTAPTGTAIANEEHTTLRWNGQGAGTAIIRIGGRIG